MITTRFSKTSPVSSAQGRHGEIILVQGNGIRPARWDGTGLAVDAGIDAPELPLGAAYDHAPEGVDESDLPHAVKPTPGPTEVPEETGSVGRITVNPDKHYYVARTDIYKAGNVYYAPPEVTYSTLEPITDARGRKAAAKCFLNQSSVSEARMDDGGKYYPSAPSVELSDSHGKGAVIRAVLDAPDARVTPGNDPDTGLTGYTILANGPWPEEESFPGDALTRYMTVPFLDIPIETNGTFTLYGPGFGYWWTVEWSTNPDLIGTRQWSPFRARATVTIEGKTSAGTGAVLRVNGAGWQNQEGITLAHSIGKALPLKWGADYSPDEEIYVYVHNYAYFDSDLGRYITQVNRAKDIVIRAYAGADLDNPGTTPYPLRNVVLDNGGSGYLVAPDLEIISKTGYGAYATCTVKDGRIATVTLENPGGGYTTPPQVRILAGGAEAFAVARPHLRGSYQCFYRFVDETPEEKGGPIPGNVSPVAEVDCGEGATSLTWNVPTPPGRARKVELWRTTSNQALTLYRVATISSHQYLDDLTDEELRDPDRDDYEAMPFVLPNGEINAMRFTVPPNDKSVVVRFQDRFWYAVDTSGEEPNTLAFSEVDEPESVPVENEIILQQNSRDADAISALIPFGPTLLVMQARHAYSLTFSKQPLIDAQVTPMAYRGCTNQRCWEIHDGVCYVLDQVGVYAIASSGEISPISMPVEDIFLSKVSRSSERWHFLSIDPATQTLRAFVSFIGDDAGGKPTAALCYAIDTKAWWVERYPQQVTSGVNVRLSNGDFRCVYGASGGGYILGEGRGDAGRGSIVTVTLTEKGSGYRTPPKVLASGGSAAEFEASINDDGEVTAIWIKNAGYGYESGELYVSPPDDPNTSSHAQAAATYVATPIGTDTAMYPIYRVRSGNVPYPTDKDDEKLGGDQYRGVSLTYLPQPTECVTSMRAYYNNSPYPRGNAAPRDRGNGFRQDIVDNASRLDMAENTVEYGTDSGIATADFSSRSLGDVRSTDRHVSVEFVGARKSATPVCIFEVTTFGSG